MCACVCVCVCVNFGTAWCLDGQWLYLQWFSMQCQQRIAPVQGSLSGAFSVGCCWLWFWKIGSVRLPSPPKLSLVTSQYGWEIGYRAATRYFTALLIPTVAGVADHGSEKPSLVQRVAVYGHNVLWLRLILSVQRFALAEAAFLPSLESSS